MTDEQAPLLEYDKTSAFGAAKTSHQHSHKRVLCVCSAGLLRSPTAAEVLSREPFGYNTRAAGLQKYALIPVTPVLLHWADEVVCMTFNQEKILQDLTTKRVICLHIQDIYDFRSPTLQQIIARNYTTALNSL